MMPHSVSFRNELTAIRTKLLRRVFSRKDAKAQRSRKGESGALRFLCAFASLREKSFFENERNQMPDKLIIALDVETPKTALELVQQLRSVAGMFKVGSQLFTAAGPQIVRDIIAHDSKVFLDLKFHDIPHQVAGAARSAAELGVSLFTIHSSGGSEMMRAAVDSVNEVGAKTGARSKILAISVLTSIDATILAQIGVTSTPAESVLRLVKLAEAAGVDGVVASPQEIESIRQTVSRPEFLVVTPG